MTIFLIEYVFMTIKNDFFYLVGHYPPMPMRYDTLIKEQGERYMEPEK